MLLINNRDQLEWQPGLTVQAVLDQLGYNYVLITVSVNGKLVAQEDYSTFEVPDQASITVFHLAHGG